MRTEEAFSDALRPDFLVLGCLRGDPAACTFTLILREVAGRIAPDRLQKPHWMTKVDESCRVGAHAFDDGEDREPLPIVTGAEDDAFIVFDQDLMAGVTSAAQRILADIGSVYHERRRGHALKPGEILVIDNNRAVHGRSAFLPSLDGGDRSSRGALWRTTSPARATPGPATGGRSPRGTAEVPTSPRDSLTSAPCWACNARASRATNNRQTESGVRRPRGVHEL